MIADRRAHAAVSLGVSISNQKSSINNFFMTNRTRTDILLMACFCAFVFFYGMGQFGLIGADEPRYAQVAREMLERHDWITPVLGGHAWLEKPPLYYWQAMLAYSAVGVSDVSARIPAAVDATLLVVAVYLFFRRFRRGVEIDAALITASCTGVIGFAHAASMDMALAAAFGVGMLAWWAWRESEERIYLAVFYVCMALGMLAKGPVAPVLAAATIALFAMTVREIRLVLRTLWVPGILLFCVIALPWYVAVQLRNPQFFREFILQHNLARFSSDLYHHRQPFWYYLPVVALALVPWSVFVTAAFAEAVRSWWAKRKSFSGEPSFKMQFSLFACCWLVVPVGFFSISQSKLPGYILPAIPAGAVLLADYVRRHLAQGEAGPVSKGLALLHAVVAGAPIVPSLLIAYLITEHRLPGGKPMMVAVAIAFALCAAIAMTLVSRSRLRMLRFVTLIPVLLSVWATVKFGSTEIDRALSARPLSQTIAEGEMHPLPLAVFGVSREMEYGLTFYRNQTTVRYEWGSVPTEEHLLVAPATWKINVAKQTAGRRVLPLGHYAPQDVDYYWVSAADAAQ
jgi:4-amino-4-deoxy-L-arabinose transferase-like glycosyltransferase